MSSAHFSGSTGSPLGGNEDLRSNAAGADFGDEALDGNGKPLGDQVVEYLERAYGPIMWARLYADANHDYSFDPGESARWLGRQE